MEINVFLSICAPDEVVNRILLETSGRDENVGGASIEPCEKPKLDENR